MLILKHTLTVYHWGVKTLAAGWTIHSQLVWLETVLKTFICGLWWCLCWDTYCQSGFGWWLSYLPCYPSACPGRYISSFLSYCAFGLLSNHTAAIFYGRTDEIMLLIGFFLTGFINCQESCIDFTQCSICLKQPCTTCLQWLDSFLLIIPPWP